MHQLAINYFVTGKFFHNVPCDTELYRIIFAFLYFRIMCSYFLSLSNLNCIWLLKMLVTVYLIKVD